MQIWFQYATCFPVDREIVESGEKKYWSVLFPDMQGQGLKVVQKFSNFGLPFILTRNTVQESDTKQLIKIIST